MDPAPPPVTVSIPGRGAGPVEVLSAGPAGPAGSARRPLPAWAQGAVVASVLLAVVATGAQRESPAAPAADPARTAPAVLPATSVAGVSSSVALAERAERAPFVTPITVAVVLRPSDGRGDSGGSPQAGDVALLDVTARGFGIVVSRTPPFLLGALDRTSGAPTVVRLGAEVVVTDCAVDARAPRRVDLRVRRGDGPVGVVPAAVAPDVVHALDRLVARTCRRPRG